MEKKKKEKVPFFGTKFSGKLFIKNFRVFKIVEGSRFLTAIWYKVFSNDCEKKETKKRNEKRKGKE